MIPILMVSFAAAGFVLASHPTLLQDIFNKILNNVSDPTLATTLKAPSILPCSSAPRWVLSVC